jgi:hypothetical protein
LDISVLSTLCLSVYVTVNAACFIGSRSKNLTDQEDKGKGLELEGFEGKGSEREGVKGLFCVFIRAGIFKPLWSPRIDAKASIPPAYIAWRAGTITLFLLGAQPP